MTVRKRLQWKNGKETGFTGLCRPCTPPPAWGEAGGRWVVKISEKSLLGGGGSKISMLVGRGYIVGGRGGNFVVGVT